MIRPPTLFGLVAPYDRPTASPVKVPRTDQLALEIISPGAFTKSLRQTRRLPILIGHDSSRRVGTFGTGGSYLFQNDVGLFACIKLPENDEGFTCWAAMRKFGHLGASISLAGCVDELVRMRSDPWDSRRRLHEVSLSEVSVVFPPKCPSCRSMWLRATDDLNVMRLWMAYSE